MSGKNVAKYKKFDVSLPEGELTLYAGARVLAAMKEITTDMTLYKGVRLAEVMQAVYEQGCKDGRKEIIKRMDDIKKTVKYLPPGRPKKAKKKT